MVKKLILFDIDKTLVNEMQREGNPWRSAFKSVYGVDCPITIPKTNTHGMTHKEIAIENMKSKGLNEDEILKKLDLFIETLETVYKKSLENGKIVLFPRIPELLQKLSEKEHILGLITGNTKLIAFDKLKKAGIGHFFSIGGFGDDSTSREDLIKLALERTKEKYSFEINEENIFVIGDTPKDISAAEKFNIQTIGVATGIYSKKELSNAGADFALDNLENVEKVLEIIN